MLAIISHFKVIAPLCADSLILVAGKWLVCNDDVHKAREFLDMSQGIYFVTFYYIKSQTYVDTEVDGIKLGAPHVPITRLQETSTRA